MRYRFLRGESVGDGAKRVARAQLSKASEQLADMADPVTAIHDVRKRCKKLRGLVRLIRPGLGGCYPSANRAFKDAAAGLAPYRDAHSRLKTFDSLVAAHGQLLPDGAIHLVRRRLADRSDSVSEILRQEPAEIERVAGMLDRGRALIDDWDVEDSFAVVGGGLVKTYRQCRKGLEDAYDRRRPEAMHEWRKQVKYHWYHVRLMRDCAPSVLRPLARRLDQLSDALGDAHDLTVLVERLHGWSGMDQQAVGAVCIVANGVREELERRSLAAGSRLFAETPKALSKRFGAYWSTWRMRGEEQPIGAMTDLWPG